MSHPIHTSLMQIIAVTIYELTTHRTLYVSTIASVVTVIVIEYVVLAACYIPCFVCSIYIDSYRFEIPMDTKKSRYNVWPVLSVFFFHSTYWTEKFVGKNVYFLPTPNPSHSTLNKYFIWTFWMCYVAMHLFANIRHSYTGDRDRNNQNVKY